MEVKFGIITEFKAYQGTIKDDETGADYYFHSDRYALAFLSKNKCVFDSRGTGVLSDIRQGLRVAFNSENGHSVHRFCDEKLWKHKKAQEEQLHSQSQLNTLSGGL